MRLIIIFLACLMSVGCQLSRPAMAQEVVVPVVAAKSNSSDATEAGLVTQANEAFYGRHLKEARAFCQRAIEENNLAESHITAISARFFLNRTACDIGLHDYQSARKTLESVAKFMRGEKNAKENEVLLADCFLLRGELAYKSGDSKSALPLYKQALTTYIDHFGLECPTISQPLEGMAVCLRKEGHLGRALSAERQAALNDFINLGLGSFRLCETLRFLVQLEHEAGYDDRAHGSESCSL